MLCLNFYNSTVKFDRNWLSIEFEYRASCSTKVWKNRPTNEQRRGWVNNLHLYACVPACLRAWVENKPFPCLGFCSSMPHCKEAFCVVLWRFYCLYSGFVVKGKLLFGEVLIACRLPMCRWKNRDRALILLRFILVHYWFMGSLFLIWSVACFSSDCPRMRKNKSSSVIVSIIPQTLRA